MAVSQIRGGVPEGLRVGDGSARRDRPLFPVLQSRAAAPESWLPDPGSDPPGGVTFMNGGTKRRSAFLESGTLSPNPWDLTPLGRNVWCTVEGTRTEDRAPQGCDPSAGSRAGMARGGFDAEAAPKLQTRPRRILAYCGRKMVLTMGSTLDLSQLFLLWLCAAFFTSIWLWLYAGSGFILKAARRFDIGFDWFNRKFDIEKKPLQIGRASCRERV